MEPTYPTPDYVTQIAMIAKDAGVEYIRVGDIEIRFPRPEPEPDPFPEVPANERGRVMMTDAHGDRVPVQNLAATQDDEDDSGYRAAFKGRPLPRLGDL